jgi:hypothetical protein
MEKEEDAMAIYETFGDGEQSHLQAVATLNMAFARCHRLGMSTVLMVDGNAQNCGGRLLQGVYDCADTVPWVIGFTPPRMTPPFTIIFAKPTNYVPFEDGLVAIPPAAHLDIVGDPGPKIASMLVEINRCFAVIGAAYGHHCSHRWRARWSVSACRLDRDVKMRILLAANTISNGLIQCPDNPKRMKMAPMTATRALERIHFAEEIGDYAQVGRCIGWHAELIANTGSDEERAELDEVRDRYRAAEQYISIHGPDSLLKQGHPFVQQLFRIRARAC